MTKFGLILMAAAALPAAAEGVEAPAPAPPPMLARSLADVDGPSVFPTRQSFDQAIPLGRAPVDMLLGVSQGHEYFARREGESSLGPQMGLVWQPDRDSGVTFFGRIDMHQLTGPDDTMTVPGSLDDLTESTTYTIGVGWKF